MSDYIIKIKNMVDIIKTGIRIENLFNIMKKLNLIIIAAIMFGKGIKLYKM